MNVPSPKLQQVPKPTPPVRRVVPESLPGLRRYPHYRHRHYSLPEWYCGEDGRYVHRGIGIRVRNPRSQEDVPGT